jgi:hypothetical protein
MNILKILFTTVDNDDILKTDRKLFYKIESKTFAVINSIIFAAQIFSV